MQQGSVDIPPGLNQKLVFVRGLIEDQSVSSRILASQQTEAKQLLELARDSYSKALATIQARNFGKAESQLNDALSAIGKARRLVPDTQSIIAQQRAEYEKTLDSVSSLLKSYISYSRRVKQPEGASAGSDNRAAYGTDTHLNSAKSYAKSEQWGKALQEVEKANVELKFEMGRVLGLMAADYFKKFDTPSEEFAHEIERNRNLLDLIPVVSTELHPSEDIKLTIEDLIEQNRAVMDLAEEYAKLRDYNKALINAKAGTRYLEIALTAAGMIMPPPSEAK